MSLSEDLEKKRQQKLSSLLGIDLGSALQVEYKKKETVMPLNFKQLNSLIGGGFRRGYVTTLFGPPGNAKSLLALNVLIGMMLENFRMTYLPLEYDKIEHSKRALGIFLGTWDAINHEAEARQKMLDVLESDEVAKAFLGRLSAMVENNPTAGETDAAGKIIIPRYDYQTAADHVEEIAKRTDLLVIDPITAIDASEGRKSEWTQQKEFIRMCGAIAKKTGSHIVLLSHSGKRQKVKGKETQLSMDDMAGAASNTRFSQCVLILDYHEPIYSDVVCLGGHTKNVKHSRTLIVSKTNFGSGKGARLAVDFTEGPRMDIFGIIRSEN